MTVLDSRGRGFGVDVKEKTPIDALEEIVCLLERIAEALECIDESLGEIDKSVCDCRSAEH